jgi:general secretion pathway protein A
VIFTAGACARVHAASGGVPREMNNLCDLAMMVAYGRRLATVDETTVARSAEDMAA